MIHAVHASQREALAELAESREEDAATMKLGGLETIFIVAVVAIFVVPIGMGILYCLTLYKALSRCSPQNRTLSPGLVWLFLIPIFSLVWQFFIVIGMTRSLHAEFVTRHIVEEQSPAKSIGLATCILMVISSIPYFGWITFIPWIVCWIIYWVKIAGFSSKIAYAYSPPGPPAGVAPAA